MAYFGVSVTLFLFSRLFHEFICSLKCSFCFTLNDLADMILSAYDASITSHKIIHTFLLYNVLTDIHLIVL
jgi:hypothetical protein